MWLWLWRPNMKKHSNIAKLLVRVSDIDPMNSNKANDGMQPVTFHIVTNIGDTSRQDYMLLRLDNYDDVTPNTLWLSEVRYLEWMHLTVAVHEHLMKVYMDGQLVGTIETAKAGSLSECIYRSNMIITTTEVSNLSSSSSSSSAAAVVDEQSSFSKFNRSLLLNPWSVYPNNVAIQVLGVPGGAHSHIGMVSNLMVVTNHACDEKQIGTFMNNTTPPSSLKIRKQLQMFGMLSREDFCPIPLSGDFYLMWEWKMCPVQVCGNVCFNDNIFITTTTTTTTSTTSYRRKKNDHTIHTDPYQQPHHDIPSSSRLSSFIDQIYAQVRRNDQGQLDFVLNDIGYPSVSRVSDVDTDTFNNNHTHQNNDTTITTFSSIFSLSSASILIDYLHGSMYSVSRQVYQLMNNIMIKIFPSLSYTIESNLTSLLSKHSSVHQLLHHHHHHHQKDHLRSTTGYSQWKHAHLARNWYTSTTEGRIQLLYKYAIQRLNGYQMLDKSSASVDIISRSGPQRYSTSRYNYDAFIIIIIIIIIIIMTIIISIIIIIIITITVIINIIIITITINMNF